MSLPTTGVGNITPFLSFAAFAAQLLPAEDILFGTGVAPSASQVGITNISQLSALFSPYHSFSAGQISVINYEVETYSQFNTTNHAFLADRLNLTGSAPNGWGPQVSTTLTAAVAASNVLPCASTTGANLGQVVQESQYGSLLFITGIDGSNNVTVWGTSAGNGSPPSITDVQGATVNFLPYYVATLSANSLTTDTQLTCLPTAAGGTAPWPIPAGITVGMKVYFYGAIMSNAYVCHVTGVNTSTGVITLDGPIGYSAAVGTRVIFGPPVTSGQIWRNRLLPVLNNNWGTFLGLQASLVMPSTACQGAWPGFWIYGSIAGAPGLNKIITASEQDIVELEYKAGLGSNTWTGTTHSSSGAAVTPYYICPQGTWINNNSGWQPGYDFGDGSTHTFATLITPTDAFSYVDDVLVKASLINWQGAPGQWGIQLALGVLSGSGIQQGFLPTAIGSQSYTVGVKRVQAWAL